MKNEIVYLYKYVLTAIGFINQFIERLDYLKDTFFNYRLLIYCFIIILNKFINGLSDNNSRNLRFKNKIILINQCKFVINISVKLMKE